MLLKTGEEEFWTKQHPCPYIFPDSPGGTSYERYECYKVPEWVSGTLAPLREGCVPRLLLQERAVEETEAGELGQRDHPVAARG
ncbi:hypothetical protein KUCAC02_011780 [Chaenocephalus aceratus]|uniref:Uncharacterized protein n=1 Tax=Chaenocephalus aceratus TaxID=36190 RepID=A0ACB9WYE3_CHAAC|nr:hypothetical protein KUCAC02_011780 [Chaenocephalus aceratus]